MLKFQSPLLWIYIFKIFSFFSFCFVFLLQQLYPLPINASKWRGGKNDNVNRVQNNVHWSAFSLVMYIVSSLVSNFQSNSKRSPCSKVLCFFVLCCSGFIGQSDPEKLSLGPFHPGLHQHMNSVFGLSIGSNRTWNLTINLHSWEFSFSVLLNRY